MRSFELSESELQEKIEAARPAAVAAEAVHELRALREQSGAEGGALAELRAARELIAAAAEPASATGAEPAMDGSGRAGMAESMAEARAELERAEELVQHSTWSQVPVELSAEEQEEIRHKIYGSIVGSADPEAPPGWDAAQEDSVMSEERAEAARLRSALLRFGDDADGADNLAADGSASSETSSVHAQLERMAYETERSRLAGQQRQITDERELQRLQAEISRTKGMSDELARAKEELRAMQAQETAGGGPAGHDGDEGQDTELLQQTLLASRRRAAALDDEVQDLRRQLAEGSGDAGGSRATEELEQELAKEKALRERYAELCVKLEAACETSEAGESAAAQADSEALATQQAEASARLEEAEAAASEEIERLAAAVASERERNARTESDLREAKAELQAAQALAASRQQEKEATEEAMAVSVGAQEERLTDLNQQLHAARRAALEAPGSPGKAETVRLQESLRVERDTSRQERERSAAAEERLTVAEQSVRDLTRRLGEAEERAELAEEEKSAAEGALAEQSSASVEEVRRVATAGALAPSLLQCHLSFRTCNS